MLNKFTFKSREIHHFRYLSR